MPSDRRGASGAAGAALGEAAGPAGAPPAGAPNDREPPARSSSPAPARRARPGAAPPCPEPVLQAIGVAKAYPLYDRPWDRLLELLGFDGGRPRRRDFWALKGLDLDVRAGEAVGVIGSNGAGKSTLLKVLGGMCPPTRGRVEARGSVSLLLDLGLGFHPDFTGRENARLALGLMGLSGGEAERRIGEVASYAEIGEFFDRPLRTYSAGMAMRLGFSVAISGDPQILLVDEVFAVGDHYFQWKCTETMKERMAAGVALVLVTHDLLAVNLLCRRAMWLREGAVEREGEAHAVVEAYRNFERDREGAERRRRDALGACGRLGPAPATIESIDVLDTEGGARSLFSPGEGFTLRIRVGPFEGAQGASLGFGIFRNDGVLCFCTTSEWDGLEMPPLDRGRTFEVHLPEPTLQPGLYQVSAAVLLHGGLVVWERQDGTAWFEIAGGDAVGVGRAYGVCDLDRRWRIV